MEGKELETFLEAALQLLGSHSHYLQKAYKEDISFNNSSLGYKEEETMMNLLEKVLGADEFFKRIEKIRNEISQKVSN